MRAALRAGRITAISLISQHDSADKKLSPSSSGSYRKRGQLVVERSDYLETTISKTVSLPQQNLGNARPETGSVFHENHANMITQLTSIISEVNHRRHGQ